MDTAANYSKFLSLFLLSILIVCSSGLVIHASEKQIVQKQLKRPNQQKLQLSIQHDFINPPVTTLPTTPVTNPVTTPATTITTPPDTLLPPPTTIVPPTNPFTTITPPPAITIPPAIPITDPAVNPPAVTNPVTTPSTTNPDGGFPVTTPTGSGFPATTPSTTNPRGGTTGGGFPATTPVVGPPANGQSWCVVRSGLPETALQVALDYACGIGGADCSAIQEGGSCYNPNSLQNHASYAFNSYYQRNPVTTSCDFGGAAAITNMNPSSGSCIFTTFSSSASPTTGSPFTTTSTPTPTTQSSSGATPIGSGTPPAFLSPSNPALGGGIAGYGESPYSSTANSSSDSILSISRQPFIGCIVAVTTIIRWRFVSNI